MARPDFFRVVGFSKCITGTLINGFFTSLAFAPELLPLSYLGPLGSFLGNLVDNNSVGLVHLWWFLFGLHVAEAALALRVCTDKGIRGGAVRSLWFLQTVFFGYFSLEMLFDYHPDRPKQK
ncbi:transmembrane protein 254-like [Neosynchiropus ocellatus]